MEHVANEERERSVICRAANHSARGLIKLRPPSFLSSFLDSVENFPGLILASREGRSKEQHNGPVINDVLTRGG